jgi:hypothetical protein
MNANQPSPLILVAQSGSQTGHTFDIQPGINTIGRDASHEIYLPDDSISRNHARIVVQPEGTWIEDLASTNGTFVNKEKVTGRTRLQPGDIIQLGNTVTLGVESHQFGLGLEDTVVPGSIPSSPEPLRPPSTPPPPLVRPIHTPPTQERSPWFWLVSSAVAVVIILGAILAALFFFVIPRGDRRINVALPPSTATQAAAALVGSPAPSPSPAPSLSLTPTLSPTPEPVFTPPGLAAMLAEERVQSQTSGRRVDPFCNAQIEVKANEPVLISWEQRLATDGDTDYLVQWLDAVYFDIRLDGKPVTELGRPLNYSLDESCAGDGPCSSVLNWWINLGLLNPDAYHLTLDWYTDRPTSSGLDLEPADGKLDVFGPGRVGGGSCDILVVAVSAPTPIVMPATLTPGQTPTAFAALATPSPAPRLPPTEPPSFGPGVFQDFETQSTWKRGDQKWGEFNRSAVQAHGGSYSGELTYDFPDVEDDYVVFLQTRRLSGQPNAITAWVYGDNSGNYLNVWIQDAAGEVWQMPFGRIQHNGWGQMTALLDPFGEWPVDHIEGREDGAINYPISFDALVVDHILGAASRGTIYIDDLASQEAVSPLTVAQQPTPSGPAPFSIRIGQHKYELWGYADDPCANHFNDDIHMKGLHLEILLTNNSSSKIPDNWLPTFTSAQGKGVKACPAYYEGSGPPPGEERSLTFFMLVTEDDYLRTVTLTLDGFAVQVCLDPSGVPADC